jgi:hypothetical protein
MDAVYSTLSFVLRQVSIPGRHEVTAECPLSEDLDSVAEVGSPSVLASLREGRSRPVVTGVCSRAISSSRSVSPLSDLTDPDKDTAASPEPCELSDVGGADVDQEYDLDQDLGELGCGQLMTRSMGQPRSSTSCTGSRKFAAPDSVTGHFTQSQTNHLPHGNGVCAIKTSCDAPSGVSRNKAVDSVEDDGSAQYVDTVRVTISQPSPTLYDSDDGPSQDQILCAHSLPSWTPSAGYCASSSPVPEVPRRFLVLSALANFLIDIAEPTRPTKDTCDMPCSGIRITLSAGGQAFVDRPASDVWPGSPEPTSTPCEGTYTAPAPAVKCRKRTLYSVANKEHERRRKAKTGITKGGDGEHRYQPVLKAVSARGSGAGTGQTRVLIAIVDDQGTDLFVHPVPRRPQSLGRTVSTTSG